VPHRANRWDAARRLGYDDDYLWPGASAHGRRAEASPATVGAKIRNALSFLRPLAEDALIEVRLHAATLYNSIYRVVDQVLVNAHVYGNTAACAPVLHLRKVSGGSLVTVYLECIDRVWDEAKPWNGEDT
jgi:hypothetical protein